MFPLISFSPFSAYRPRCQLPPAHIDQDANFKKKGDGAGHTGLQYASEKADEEANRSSLHKRLSNKYNAIKAIKLSASPNPKRKGKRSRAEA